MSFTGLTVTPQPAGVSLVRDVRALANFLDPACAAAVWEREIPSDVIGWLNKVDLKFLPKARVVLQAQAVADTVFHLCDIAQIPTGPQLDWFVNDVGNLAKNFADLMRVSFVRLRLEAVTTNACRKFHLDAITARLVCTYRGTGTQYGTTLGSEEPEQIFTTATGSPILLRGSRWLPRPETGLLHRSPPIEGTGATRLVLVLDPIIDPDLVE